MTISLCKHGHLRVWIKTSLRLYGILRCSLILLFLTFYPRNQKIVPHLFKAPQFSWSQQQQKKNESNHGIVKGSTAKGSSFWKINNTVRFFLPCSQGQATFACRFFIFAQYIILAILVVYTFAPHYPMHFPGLGETWFPKTGTPQFSNGQEVKRYFWHSMNIFLSYPSFDPRLEFQGNVKESMRL